MDELRGLEIFRRDICLFFCLPDVSKTQYKVPRQHRGRGEPLCKLRPEQQNLQHPPARAQALLREDGLVLAPSGPFKGEMSLESFLKSLAFLVQRIFYVESVMITWTERG